MSAMRVPALPDSAFPSAAGVRFSQPSPAEPVVQQPAGNPEPVVEPPVSIEELVLRLTNKRPIAEDIRELKAAAGTDKEEELMKVLDFLWRGGSRYDGFKLLTVGIVHQLLVGKKPYEYR